MIAGASMPDRALAGNIAQKTKIDCRVSDGRGSTSFGQSKFLGQAAGTLKFSNWVFAPDGVNLRDRIGLFWDPAGSAKTLLRVSIDGPVSKPAQVLSVTDSTAVAATFTSDQRTTRAWLITINFRQNLVTAVATSSGPVAIRSQLLTLTCRFQPQSENSIRKSAADTWRR